MTLKYVLHSAHARTESLCSKAQRVVTGVFLSSGKAYEIVSRTLGVSFAHRAAEPRRKTTQGRTHWC